MINAIKKSKLASWNLTVKGKKNKLKKDRYGVETFRKGL